VLGFYRVQANGTVEANGTPTSGTALAMCNTGDIVTGGGYFGIKTTSHVQNSNPLNVGNVPSGWSVTVRSDGIIADGFTVYAVCADVTP
jgi:hypothetical protein